jgi:RNA methyltransferase, TrmH family
MLSKRLIKLINSLKYTKYRQQYGLFVAEGKKMINDLIRLKVPIKTIISSVQFEEKSNLEYIKCENHELSKVSFLKTSSDTIALVKIPDYQFNKFNIINKLTIALDGVQDPGNMGTIIRTANWFGIENILCSKDCADVYNPKVVQATMGALMKVKVHYLDLVQTLKDLKENADFEIYGTFMNAKSVYTTNLASNGLIVLGNEGKGISKDIEQFITKRMSIPSYSKVFEGAESLNVGVATGIIIAEFRRQQL